MSSKRPAKSVQIGGNAFSITGERTAEGTLRFSVLDLDCAISEPDDVIALQFQEALKRRLVVARKKREAQSSLPCR